MSYYVRKPIIVEARHLVGTTAEVMDVYLWVQDHLGSVPPPCDDDKPHGRKLGVTIDPEDGCMMIRTEHGDMKAALGDWIIKDAADEWWVSSPDVFASIFEPHSIIPDNN